MTITNLPQENLDWREYKGYVLACGDCVYCEVVNGKAVAKSVFVETKVATVKEAA